MSTQPPPPPPPPSMSSSSGVTVVTQKLEFAPLHRTTELENIHAQVLETDLQSSTSNQQQASSTRKVLMKHLTVIGDGSDIDNNQLITRQ